MNKSVVLDVCRHLVVLVTCKNSQSRRASFWVPQIVVGKSIRQNQQLVCASLSKVLHSPRVCCSAGRRRRMAARNQNQASDIESSAAATQNSGNPSKSVNVIIQGKVQGVFYRKWTVHTAKELGLNGWVRNCRNGSVEAVFSGASSTVDNMIEKCRNGPSLAQVTGITVSSWDTPVPPGFEQKPTIW
ncbi:unnamed protein product [Sphagnum balticum]